MCWNSELWSLSIAKLAATLGAPGIGAFAAGVHTRGKKMGLQAPVRSTLNESSLSMLVCQESKELQLVDEIERDIIQFSKYKHDA